MNNDPIVDEVHKIREQISRECDDDMERIFEYLKKKETERSDRIIHKKKKSAENLSV